MNGIKICMFLLNPYINDGRVRRTCRFLSSKGYGIVVIAESPTGKDDELEMDGVKIIRLCSSGLPTSKGRFVKYMFRAAKKGAAIKSDIYHAFDLDTLAPALFASTVNRAALIYEAHEFYTGLEALLNRPLTRAVWSILEKTLIHRANKVITVNGSIAGRLSERYAVPKPEVIYSCSDMQDMGKMNYLREKFDIAEYTPIALYLGVLRRGQGLEILPDVLSKHESAALVIVGNGPLRNQIIEKCRGLKIEKRVYFCDWVEGEDLHKYYRSADIGVLLMEPVAENNRLALPNKFFSYLAAGLPVIVSDIPELRLFVDKYRLGLVVPFDIDSMVNAFNKLINEDSFYRDCRKNALKFSGEFTWEKQAQKYLSIYDELING